jgi:catechol 2,3-dioxygenase-like lactoylglutathione lyase family enzyme
MPRVTGIGGVFFKANDPERLCAWYERHLGLKGKPGEGAILRWADEADGGKGGMTVFAIFPKDTTYFGPGGSGFMVNFRVDDLDGLLEALRAEGVAIDPKREDHEYGRFAWITDPEGNRVELWQPPRGQ